MLIKNFQELNLSSQRKIALETLEAGLLALQPENYLKKQIKIENNILEIQNFRYDLNNYKSVYLIGFGKGSSKVAKYLEDKLEQYLKEGYIIDLIGQDFKKIQFTLGSHPLPSTNNLFFTQKIIERFKNNLTENDLVIVITCGGGSVMFELPAKIEFEKIKEINETLLKSGANIYQMNTIRKHLSLVKGGGLAKILYPAKIISLILSDVPGDDIGFVASGPTVQDETTLVDAIEIIKSFNLQQKIKTEWLIETPKEDIYFKKIDYFIILSNKLALEEMKNYLENNGYPVEILNYNLQGRVEKIAKGFFNLNKKGFFLAGGETTVEVKGQGKGGRNQELVLWFLKYLEENPKNSLFISFNSDGYDNTEFGGAIGDLISLKKAKDLNLNLIEFLTNNDSFNFFKLINDEIITGRLESNVADLMILFNF